MIPQLQGARQAASSLGPRRPAGPALARARPAAPPSAAPHPPPRRQDPWNFSPPGGESQKQVEERMVRYVLDNVLPAAKEGGPPALVVGHGLAIRW